MLAVCVTGLSTELVLSGFELIITMQYDSDRDKWCFWYESEDYSADHPPINMTDEDWQKVSSAKDQMYFAATHANANEALQISQCRLRVNPY